MARTLERLPHLIDRPVPVEPRDLFPMEFIRGSAAAPEFDALVAMGPVQPPPTIESPWDAFPEGDSEWESHIAALTRFPSWRAMITAGKIEFAERMIRAGRRPPLLPSRASQDIALIPRNETPNGTARILPSSTSAADSPTTSPAEEPRRLAISPATESHTRNGPGSLDKTLFEAALAERNYDARPLVFAGAEGPQVPQRSLEDPPEAPSKTIPLGDANLSWFDTLIRRPLPDGLIALFYVRYGWFGFNDSHPEFVGVLEPTSKLVVRDDKVTTNSFVEQEVERTFNLWAKLSASGNLWTTTDWDTWFQKNQIDLLSPSYRNLREQIEPGFRDRLSQAGIKAAELAQTAIEHNVSGAPKLAAAPFYIFRGRHSVATRTAEGLTILTKGRQRVLIGVDKHHPVFQYLLRALDEAEIPTPATTNVKKFADVPQNLVELPMNFHVAILHDLWRIIAKEKKIATSTRVLAEEIKSNDSNVSNIMKTILDGLEDFYRGFFKDNPDLRTRILNEVYRVRREIGF